MFNKKEITIAIIGTILLAFMINISRDTDNAILFIVIAAIIIFTDLFIKKWIAPFYSIKIEYDLWKLKRYYWYEHSKLKHPIPLGILVPFFISIISLGYIRPAAFFGYTATNLPAKRVQKRYGRVRKPHINEYDLAFTCLWSTYALLGLAVIGAIINVPLLSKYAIYYGFWNLMPISNLDGMKIFFGSLIGWLIAVVVYVLALIIAIAI